MLFFQTFFVNNFVMKDMRWLKLVGGHSWSWPEHTSRSRSLELGPLIDTFTEFYFQYNS